MILAQLLAMQAKRRWTSFIQPASIVHSPGGHVTPSEVCAFGRSLHVDVYGVDPKLCDDLGFGYQLLDDLVGHLKMTKQSPPFIFRSPEGEYPDKAGLSGWVPLIESGISLHTLTVKGFVSLDIYTCGHMELEPTLAFLSERLCSKDCEVQYLVRGTRYHVS